MGQCPVTELAGTVQRASASTGWRARPVLLASPWRAAALATLPLGPARAELPLLAAALGAWLVVASVRGPAASTSTAPGG